jgi:hypothetical protein
MTPEELTAAEQAQAESYAAEIALITAAMAAFALAFSKYFLGPALTAAKWIELLAMLYPEVARRREMAAMASRDFYDNQRALFAPTLRIAAQDLERYEFEWFVSAMEPVRARMSQADTAQRVAADMALIAVREVEMAARRQIIHAVEDDVFVDEYLEASPAEREKLRFQPSVRDELLALLEGGAEEPAIPGPTRKPKLRSVGTTLGVKGWARVATGDETCAWCLMLVSRGPVYSSAANAGLREDISEAEFVALYNKNDLETYGAKISEKDDAGRSMVDEWHKGCDCLIVPVFNKKTWFGNPARDRARDLWKEATKAAKAELKKNPKKTYYSFNGPGYEGDGDKNPGRYKVTLNREAINQLRQKIAKGEISSAEWAALNAAA